MPSRKAIPPDHQRCEYTKSDGKRCTNPQDVLHHPLCDSHHRVMLRKLEESRIESEQMAFGPTILAPDQPLDSAQAVNAALTRVFRGLCEGRITPRHAAALGYIAQLIISTLPGMAREAQARPKHPVLGANPEAVFAELASALRDSFPAAADPQHVAQAFQPVLPDTDALPHADPQPPVAEHRPPTGASPQVAFSPKPDKGNGNGHAGGVERAGLVDPGAPKEIPGPGAGNSETPRAAREQELRAGARARRYIARSP